MEAVAVLKRAHVSPQKARLIADLVRGKPVEKALETLSFAEQKSAHIIKKVLESAVANAENNYGLDIDELNISRIFVDQGPTFKRVRPRARGRADRIVKRTSHITVAVADKQDS